MRVLLDESLPRHLAVLVTGHEVSTVRAEGWTGYKNGALLRAARERDFQVLVTADRRMERQQDIAHAGLALVVLQAPSTRVADLALLVPRLLEVLPTLQPGQVVHIAS